MNINELFENIQDEFLEEELNGEFLLHGNVMIWSYNLMDDSEELLYLDEDEEEAFSFEATSSEELLQEAYQEDLEKIQQHMDSLGVMDDWTFSDQEIVDDVIVFKIF